MIAKMLSDIGKFANGDFSPLKDPQSFSINGRNPFSGRHVDPSKDVAAVPKQAPSLSPSIGSRERDNVIADLVRREAQIRSRLDEARRNDDQKAIERLTRRLEENTEELRRNREATVEKQSFDGSGGNLGGLVHNAVYGGGAAFSPPSIPRYKKGSNGFGRPRGKNELPALSDDPFLNLIGRAEGTDKGRGYNETLGYGAFTGGPQNLVGMTLDQIDKLQTQMLRNPRNRFNSSAVGRYQIVRTTLRRLRQQLGLKGDELYDEAMQDRLARRLYQQRGNNPAGLRNEWEGLRRVPGDEISRSYAESIRRSSDALVRRQRDRQTVEGNARLRIDLNGFPRGTRATPQADGMFREIELNRGRTMAEGVDI
jgi:muramidase (phage lysozyme)